MTGNLYTYVFEDDTSKEIAAGDVTLTCSFYWPEVYQEQSDTFERHVDEMSQSDPVMRDGKPDREYDWIDYYNAIPALGDGMEEWVADNTTWPVSLSHLVSEPTTIYTLLTQRREQAAALALYRAELKEMLHYQMTIVDNNQNTVVMAVIPGGYVNNQDNTWSARFTADVEEIPKGSLSIATFNIEVWDQNV